MQIKLKRKKKLAFAQKPLKVFVMNFADKWKIVDVVFSPGKRNTLVPTLFWGEGKQWTFFININMHMTAEKNIMRFCLDNFHLVEKTRVYKYL